MTQSPRPVGFGVAREVVPLMTSGQQILLVGKDREDHTHPKDREVHTVAVRMAWATHTAVLVVRVTPLEAMEHLQVVRTHEVGEIAMVVPEARQVDPQEEDLPAVDPLEEAPQAAVPQEEDHLQGGITCSLEILGERAPTTTSTTTQGLGTGTGIETSRKGRSYS